MPIPPSPSDAEILVAIQRGDPDAQLRLDDHFSRFLTKVARRRCDVLQLPADHIEDIVQDVYAHVLDPATTPFDPGRRSARGYLGGMVFNAAKAIKRQYRNEVDLTPEKDDVEARKEFLDPRAAEAFIAVEMRETFDRLLQDEEPAIRFIVMSHYLDDIELYELGQRVGRSAFRVSRDLKKVYARMRLRIDAAKFLHAA